jgi:signal transduction histidine kinase
LPVYQQICGKIEFCRQESEERFRSIVEMEDDPNNHISPQSKIFNAGNQLIQRVDLNDVMKNILVDLEMLIAQKRAAVHVEQLPVVEGAAVLLYQLLYNLVINALKFTSAERPPIIRVTGARELKNNVTYAKLVIEDNGIGFDQKNATRIFGTGLGLALCKKIVVRHHGQIEANGRPGQGAIFTIWLPIGQPKPTVKI